MELHPNYPQARAATPWGVADIRTPLGPHACNVATPSHGGLWVSPDLLRFVPEDLRSTPYSGGGWFEEDCDWAIPYIACALYRWEPTNERGAFVFACARKTIEVAQAWGSLPADTLARLVDAGNRAIRET